MKRHAARAALPCLTVLILACGGGGASPPTGPGTSTPAPSATPDATVGPAGGTVSNGTARLVVPAGALSASVGLTLRVTALVPLDPHAVGGAAYEIGPAGTTFAVPATLNIGFDGTRAPSGVEEGDLRLHQLAGGAWQPVAGAGAGSGGQAAAAVAAAGIYGVRWTGPRADCTSARDADFDFWLGSWSYHQGNAPLASNEITKEAGGCLVEEHFADPLGGRGRSVSLFSRLDGRWHQTYIDSAGGRIVLVGNLDGRRMLMNTAPNDRTIWDPVDADTVLYYSEVTSDGGQTWRRTLDARYTRR